MKPSIRVLLLCVLSFILGMMVMLMAGNAYQMSQGANGAPLRLNTRTGEAWTMSGVGDPREPTYRWVKISEH
jgi:hypothetical protein